MKARLEVWSRNLVERERVFVPAELKAAIRFLHTSRTQREGWGAYPGMPSDLHHTAYAVQALSLCKDEGSIGLAADGAIYLRESINGGLSKLDLGQLADLASALSSEAKPDEEYLRQVYSIAKEKLEGVASEGYDISIITLSRLLRVLFGLAPTSQVSWSWIERVLKLQRPDDGGWPAIQGEPSSALATCSVVQLLVLTEGDESRAAQAKGLRFLESYVESLSWSGIAGKGIFEQAWVLQTLAQATNVDYGLIISGIDDIVARANPDGGWGGGGAGEASNVECTSLALMALVMAGCNTFVPARLTLAALHDARLMVEQAELERDKLAEDVDQKVQIQCGKVVKERDDLRHKIGSLSVKLRTAESAMDNERQKGRERLAQLTGHLEDKVKHTIALHKSYSKIPAPQVILLGILNVSALVGLLVTRGDVFTKISTAIVAVSVILIISLWMRTYRQSVEQSFQGFPELEVLGDNNMIEMEVVDFSTIGRSSLASLRILFRRYTEGLEPAVLEELIYRLYKDVVDMPPDLGNRYIQDLGFRLDLPDKNILFLARWLEQALELRPRERKVLFDQIRRAIL